MKFHVSCLLVVLCGVLSSVAVAADKIEGTRVVGSVYGKEITAAEIELTEPIDTEVKFDARDMDRWNLMSRISRKFGSPIVDKYIQEAKIEATAAEIAKFHAVSKKRNAQNQRQWEADLAAVEKQLAEADLTKEARQALVEKKMMYARFIESARSAVDNQPADEIAKMFIRAWKVERQLHRDFGGRVIFQQFGPEALDGRRRLFEKAEKEGDLKFTDAGVRHLFYYYANMRHISGDEQALEKPWFLADDE